MSMLSKTILASVISTVVYSNLTQAAPRYFSLPDQAVKVRPGVFSLGTKIHRGLKIQGYAFLHPKEHAAKPDKPGAGNGKGNKTTESTCFAFIASGARWKNTENYIVDTDNASGADDIFILNTINQATSAWNDQASFTIFGAGSAGESNGADTDSPDDLNEVLFADIFEPNVIAVTITWGVFSGPPRSRQLIEWDQIYDDVDYIWGDADVGSGVMDLLNIAAHEVGHAAGMSHPDNSCSEETMYAYAELEETKKRTLEEGDIVGIKNLYE